MSQANLDELFYIIEEFATSKIPENYKDVSLVELGLDSLDQAELMIDLEEKYDIEISDEEASKLLTVGDIIDFLEKHPDVDDF